MFAAVVAHEGRWYVARSVNPPVTSQGRTQREALDNLTEAIHLYLESFGTGDLPEMTEPPVLTHVEVSVA
ncbi:MAG: type II toxin-antitoxin system HicB family antitoxin [Planctomycetes bacterium]|nr:type II toxin-antitoxin system HicB family antitoxin [Planctomycetota bacterium]